MWCYLLVHLSRDRDRESACVVGRGLGGLEGPDHVLFVLCFFAHGLCTCVSVCVNYHAVCLRHGLCACVTLMAFH